MPNSYVGQKCQALVPFKIDHAESGCDAEARMATATQAAREALDAKCRSVGCAPSDTMTLHVRDWDEEIAGVGPLRDMRLLVAETVAVELEGMSA